MPTPDEGHVRVAWHVDADAIAAVQLRSWRWVYRDVLPVDVLTALDVEQLADTWRDSIRRNPDARNRVLAALMGEQIVGYAVTGPSSDPDLDNIGDGEIAALHIDPDHFGKGHGSRLLNACIDTMRKDRFERGVWWLNSSDDDLRRFLTESGWAPDGAHRELDMTGDGSVTVKQVRLHTDLGEAETQR